MDVQKECISILFTMFAHSEKKVAVCLLHKTNIAVVSECVCYLNAQYLVQFPNMIV